LLEMKRGWAVANLGANFGGSSVKLGVWAD